MVHKLSADACVCLTDLVYAMLKQLLSSDEVRHLQPVLFLCRVKSSQVHSSKERVCRHGLLTSQILCTEIFDSHIDAQSCTFCCSLTGFVHACRRMKLKRNYHFTQYRDHTKGSPAASPAPVGKATPDRLLSGAHPLGLPSGTLCQQPTATIKCCFSKRAKLKLHLT